jgi:predicted kinase
MAASKYHPQTPLLILVMGVAGSGKSALATGILQRVCAVYLDNNHVADAFYPQTRRGSGYNRLRPAFYKALYTIAAENLRFGSSVLLDVPHVKEIQLEKWRRFITRLAGDRAAQLVVLRCVCSEETLQARLVQRNEERDRWKLGHWRKFLAEQPIEVAVPFTHLSIDTEKSLSVNTRHAVRYIKKNGSRREVGDGRR